MSTCRRLIVASVVVGLLLASVWAAPAAANWTTYRGDAARSGIDSSSVGSLPFSPAWTSNDLGDDMWAQPLVYNGLVIVATESNDIYALSESTGQVVWHANACTEIGSPCAPVPNGQLACPGDISPDVGITSTPVIDPATNRVFAVADSWDGSNSGTVAHHLVGFNLANGTPAPGMPMVVDPLGQDPTAQLQRAALALDAGKVLIGYGGNDGDCGTYHGWLVSAPETGGSLAGTFEVEPSSTEGAIWGAGNGPAVDSAGDAWTSTGNGADGSSYGYQESVLKLDSTAHLLDSWAPSNWAALDSGDTDLGSSDPLLLPNNLVFQIGKEGVGYLLRASSLGGEGGTPAFQAPVCGGSYGGAVYQAGIIYVACSDGLRALSLNASAPSFASVPGWQVQSDAIGPPMISGGLVWSTGWDSNVLYGLDPQTGNATVTENTPDMGGVHFVIPAASDGKLFLATGHTVEAYTIAKPAPPSSGGQPNNATTCGCGGTHCRLKVALKMPHKGRVTRASVYFNHKRVGSKRGHALKHVSFTPPKSRTSFSVRLKETTSAHRHLTIIVKYRQCRRLKRHHHAHAVAATDSLVAALLAGI